MSYALTAHTFLAMAAQNPTHRASDSSRTALSLPPERLRALVADLVADLADARQLDELIQRSITTARQELEREATETGKDQDKYPVSSASPAKTTTRFQLRPRRI